MNDLEHPPGKVPGDETDVSLRAYFSRLSDQKVREYNPDWDDEKVREWDGNFRSDGALMLVCCERDMDVNEYRRVLGEHIQQRQAQEG